MYEVVFDIKYEGFWSLAFILPGVLFILIFVIGIRKKDKLLGWNIKVLGKPATKRSLNVSLVFFLVFSVFWTGLAGYGVGTKLYSMLSSYEQGKYSVVEGPVENFDPMPYAGHKTESFTVQGVKFSYSDFIIEPGFNNTASHGGPISEGLYVRVSYINNVILKLEVKQ
ncbi:hypothetical protein QNF03_004076 [Vibrio cidicii]|nr:hypothetical protein [Vibrio cidicii]